MCYYIKNKRTDLGKFLNWFDNKFNTVEWVQIYNFYSNNDNFTITVINE